MGRAIDTVKRELIIDAKLRGETEDKIALWIKVSKRTVGAIWRLYKTKGHVLPVKNKGRPPRLGKGDMDRIKAAIKARPDITLNEMIEELGLPIKKSRLSKLLIDQGYTFKKNASPKKPAKGRRAARARRMGRKPEKAGPGQISVPG